MSNVEARVAQTLSSPDGRPLRIRGTARSGAPAAQWSRQRRLFVARLLAGDVVAGAVAIVVAGAVMTITGLAGEIGLVDWLRMEMPATLLLLIGICGLLGLYRSSTKSLMERFRLRATATLLFVFAGMLMLVREGSSVELAIIPLVGMIALVFGSWTEHLINARLRRSGVWGAPTAILGAGANSRTFARLLMS